MRWSSGFSRLTDRPEGGNQTRGHEQRQRASGRSFASVVTRKCPSLNRACFWLRELRVFYTFLNILRLICSVHGYPARRIAKGIRKCILFNALRLRFRLVASDYPGIVCILEGD